jgi:hypothetical protein
MELVWQQVEEAGLADRQLFIHCLSDTGVMCYQGLDIALARQVEWSGLADRQLFIHCLSDTGVMCYQGLDIALARQVEPLPV